MHRKTFIVTLVAALLVAWAPAGASRFLKTGNFLMGPQASTSAVSSTSTWDPANKASEIALTGGNLIATATTTEVAQYVIGTQAISGTAYWEEGVTNAAINNNNSARLWRGGIAHQTSVCNHPNSLLGSDSCSAGVAAACWGTDSGCTIVTSKVLINFSTTADTGLNFKTGDRLGFVVNMTSKKMWITNDGTHFWPGPTAGAGDGNPCTPTGGLDITAIILDGPIFPAFSGNTIAGGPSADVSTYFPTAAGFSLTKPACATAIG